MSRIINPSTPDNGLNDNDETEFYPVLSFSPHEFQVVNGQVRFVRSVAYNFHSCIQNTGGDSGGGNIPDTEIKWKSISPIDPLCGVNLEEKVVEYKVGDYMLQYRQDQPSVVQTREEAHSAYYATTLSKSRVCYIGSTLLVFISTGEKKKKAVFVLQFCQCHVCNEAWPWECASYLDGDAKGFTQVEFDALSLKPVDMTIILKGEQELRYVKLTFFPGVTNHFDMENDKDDRNFFNVAYYCSVHLDSLPCVPFKDFDKRVGFAREVPTVPPCDPPGCVDKNSIDIWISTTSKACTPKTVEAQEFELQSTFKALFDEKEFTDVVLVSKDGKLFPCNTEILSVRIPVFEKIIADRHFPKGQERRIQLEENASAVETLIKFIYFQETGIEKLSVSGLVGTLKLAYLYDLKEFEVVISKILLEKMKALEWEDVEGLWELYRFAIKEDTIQVIAGLKRPAIIELRRLILAKKNKRARQDKDDATSCMNWAFGNNAELAKELAVDLERLLNQDRNQ